MVGALKLYAWHIHEIEDAKNSVVQEYSAEYVKGIEKALAVSQELHTQSIQKEGQLRNEIKNISDKHSSLVNSLRQRPSRENVSSEGSSSTTCAPPSITGLSLSREDGEFLAGEAARAEQYLQERDFYYERYEAARKELKEIYGKD